jgi:hypothetical protein
MELNQQQKELWEELIKEGPSIRELIYIADNIHKFDNLAIKELYKRKLSEEELCEILERRGFMHGMVGFAKKILAQKNASNRALRTIIVHLSDNETEENTHSAISRLLNQNPSREDLAIIVQWSSKNDLTDIAWKRLLEKGLDISVVEIFLCGADFVSNNHDEEIFTEALKMELNENHLENLIGFSEEYKDILNQAINKFFQMNPKRARGYILDYADESCPYFVQIVEEFLLEAHKEGTFSQRDNRILCGLICKATSEDLIEKIWNKISIGAASIEELTEMIKTVESKKDQIWEALLEKSKNIKELKDAILVMEAKKESRNKLRKICKKIVELKKVCYNDS